MNRLHADLCNLVAGRPMAQTVPKKDKTTHVYLAHGGMGGPSIRGGFKPVTKP